MVASVNMSAELQEWQEDLADSTVQKNDASSLALDAFSKLAPELGCKFMIPSCS